jgi:hypothetical protein
MWLVAILWFQTWSAGQGLGKVGLVLAAASRDVP